MKALIAALLAGSALSVAGCTTPMTGMEPEGRALAADAMSPLSAPGYMQMAASSDLFEIESSRMALQMSRNQAVRSFAQTMINDHSRTSSEMTSVAQQIGLDPPPPQMLPHHQDMLQRLREVPLADFDRAYKAEQIAAHEEALTLHRNYADRGDVDPFRTLAARAAPIVEMHLGHARSLPEYAAAPAPEPYYPEPAPPIRRRAGERG